MIGRVVAEGMAGASQSVGGAVIDGVRGHFGDEAASVLENDMKGVADAVSDTASKVADAATFVPRLQLDFCDRVAGVVSSGLSMVGAEATRELNGIAAGAGHAYDAVANAVNVNVAMAKDGNVDSFEASRVGEAVENGVLADAARRLDESAADTMAHGASGYQGDRPLNQIFDAVSDMLPGALDDLSKAAPKAVSTGGFVNLDRAIPTTAPVAKPVDKTGGMSL